MVEGKCREGLHISRKKAERPPTEFRACATISSSISHFASTMPTSWPSINFATNRT